MHCGAVLVGHEKEIRGSSPFMKPRTETVEVCSLIDCVERRRREEFKDVCGYDYIDSFEDIYSLGEDYDI